MNEILFKSFIINLVLCLTLVLTAIWTSMTTPPPVLLPQLIGTTFVLGLASALGFIARFLRALYKKHVGEEY